MSDIYDSEGKKIGGMFDGEGKPFVPPVSNEMLQNTLGRHAVESLPMMGSFFGPEGTLAGVAFKNALKSWRPDLVGEAPKGLGIATDAAKEVGLNNLLPGVLSSVGAKIASPEIATTLRNFPAVRSGVVQAVSRKMMGQFAPEAESKILEEGAGAAQQNYQKLSDIAKGPIESTGNLDIGNTLRDVFGQDSGKQVAPNYKSWSASFKKLATPAEDLPSNKIGQQLLDLHKEVQAGADVAGSQKYRTITNEVLSDVRSVRNAQLATGDPKFTQQLALNKLLTGGYKESGGIVDGAKILDELGGKNKEIYEEAISDPQTLSRVKELASLIKDQQSGGKMGNYLVNYSKGKLIFGGLATLSGHPYLGVPTALAGGIALTNSKLAELMGNPAYADAVVQAMRTPASSPKAGMLMQILKNSIEPISAGAKVRVIQGAADALAAPER